MPTEYVASAGAFRVSRRHPLVYPRDSAHRSRLAAAVRASNAFLSSRPYARMTGLARQRWFSNFNVWQRRTYPVQGRNIKPRNIGHMARLMLSRSKRNWGKLRSAFKRTRNMKRWVSNYRESPETFADRQFRLKFNLPDTRNVIVGSGPYRRRHKSKFRLQDWSGMAPVVNFGSDRAGYNFYDQGVALSAGDRHDLERIYKKRLREAQYREDLRSYDRKQYKNYRKWQKSRFKKQYKEQVKHRDEINRLHDRWYGSRMAITSAARYRNAYGRRFKPTKYYSYDQAGVRSERPKTTSDYLYEWADDHGQAIAVTAGLLGMLNFVPASYGAVATGLVDTVPLMYDYFSRHNPFAEPDHYLYTHERSKSWHDWALDTFPNYKAQYRKEHPEDFVNVPTDPPVVSVVAPTSVPTAAPVKPAPLPTADFTFKDDVPDTYQNFRSVYTDPLTRWITGRKHMHRPVGPTVSQTGSSSNDPYKTLLADLPFKVEL